MFRFLILLALLYHLEGCMQGDTEIISNENGIQTLERTSVVELREHTGRLVVYQQWNHVYNEDINHFVSKLRQIEAFTTKLKMTLQKFDDNTFIYSSVSVHNASNGFQRINIGCSGHRSNVIGYDDNPYGYQIDYVFTYQDSSRGRFTCRQYSNISDNIQAGWINPSGSKFFPFNGTDITFTLTKEHNGSMLCCLYYTYTIAPDNVKVLERFVKDKTLLIIRKETTNWCPATNASDNSNIPKTSNATLDNSHVSDTTKARGIKPTASTTRKYKHTESTTSSNEPTTKSIRRNKHIENTLGKEHILHIENAERQKQMKQTNKLPVGTDQIDISQQSISNNDKNTTSYVSIVLPVLAIVLIVAIILFVIKKCCCKKRIRPQMPLPQSQNEPELHTPFYVNMLFRRECEKEIQAQEGPEYEEVVYH